MLSNGDTIPSDLTLISSGAQIPEWIQNSSLEKIDDFIGIKTNLQSINDENIFAAGDVANFFHPFSQGIALEGMVIVKNNLLKAYHDGSNLDARGSMLAASSMGSIAFQKGLGAIHSLSHPVGAIYNTHHGLTNAVFMPYVLRRNKKVIEEKIISLSRYLNLEDQTFEGFMNWILYLRKELLIPHTLKDLIQDDSKFEEMSKMAKDDPSTGGNPISLETNDFYNLYKDSYSGIL